MALLRDLPIEIVIDILSNLDALSLITCKRVCKAFHATIERETILQYHIELGVAALVENNIGHLPVGERFERLQAHLHAWDTLVPTSRAQCKLPVGTGSTYELCGGVFARGLSSNEHGTTDSLHLTALPSMVDRTDLTESVLPLGVQSSDFTMMPELDMVVLVESRRPTERANTFKIHISTLSPPSRPHPEAKQPVLTHACLDLRPMPMIRQTRFSYLMQVCGDMLGVLFCPFTQAQEYVEKWVREELVIWNWRTGEIVAVHASETTPPGTFSFLSPGALMTSSVGEAAIFVFSLPSDEDRSGQEQPSLQHRATFLLPPLRISNVAITSVLSRSDPTPCLVRHDARAHAPLFVPAPEARVFTIALTLDGPIDALDELTVFVILDTLLKPLSVVRATRKPVKITWSEWSGKARLVEARHVPDGHVCYVYGYRFITSSHARPSALGAPWKTRIQVLDFNPLATRRTAMRLDRRSREGPKAHFDDPRSVAEGFDEFVRDKRSRIYAQHVFVDAVFSGLPMVVRKRAVNGIMEALMIDGERIIGLKRSAGREVLDMMVF